MSLNQTLESGIRDLVKTELEGLEIGKLRGLIYPDNEFQIIQNLERTGVIRRIDIDQGLVRAVLNRARFDYDSMLRINQEGVIKRYADHVGFTDCFAYGLREHHFTDEEISQIPFDHGLDKDNYIRTYRDVRLFPKLTDLVLNYQRHKQRSEGKEKQPFLL